MAEGLKMFDDGASNRLATITQYGLMDSGREPAFETIVAHAAAIISAPMSAISIVDDRRQWFKAKTGLTHDGSDLTDSICATVVRGSGTLVVPNAQLDSRFHGNRSVVSDPGVRFYAGTPIRLRNGVQVGSLCVIDVEPRRGLLADERLALETLARRTVALIEVRQRARIRAATPANLDCKDVVLRDEALAALLIASAALEQAGDSVPLVLLEEVIALVDRSIAGSRQTH